MKCFLVHRWSVSWVQPLILNGEWNFSISHLTKVPPKKTNNACKQKNRQHKTWCFGQLVLRLEEGILVEIYSRIQPKKTSFSSGSQLDVCLVARVDHRKLPKTGALPTSYQKGAVFLRYKSGLRFTDSNPKNDPSVFPNLLVLFHPNQIRDHKPVLVSFSLFLMFFTLKVR